MITQSNGLARMARIAARTMLLLVVTVPEEYQIAQKKSFYRSTFGIGSKVTHAWTESYGLLLHNRTHHKAEHLSSGISFNSFM